MKTQISDKLKRRFACLAKLFFQGFQQMNHLVSASLCNRQTQKNNLIVPSNLLIWKMLVSIRQPPTGNVLIFALEWASQSLFKAQTSDFLSACARFFVVKTWPAANCDLTQIAVKYFPFNVREIRFRNIKQRETIRNFGLNLLYKKIISLDYMFQTLMFIRADYMTLAYLLNSRN